MLEAENGREALEILEREKVDLVLSDWMMPELDGPGLCKAIKQDERFRSIHFILMTALDQPAQIAEGLTRGADDFCRNQRLIKKSLLEWGQDSAPGNYC